MNTPENMVIILKELGDIKASLAENRALHEKNADNLADQKEDLKEHIRRTNLLEDKIEKDQQANHELIAKLQETYDKKFSSQDSLIDRALAPQKWLKWTVVVLGGASTIIGSMYGLLQWIRPH